MKILYISNIASGHAVSSFSKINVLAAKDIGLDFHLAENFDAIPDEIIKTDEKEYGIKTHHIDFVRTPYDPRNIKAYKQVVKLIKEEKIDVIHCNTPIGGVVGRLAGKKTGVKKIIYQAHGFHFFKDAPVLNWLIYYPIEKWLAHYTDVLLTINQEDYKRGNSFRLRKKGKVYYIPGVGIDTSLYQLNPDVRRKKRSELGITDEELMVISAGDIIKRKNYKTSIEAIAKTNNNNIQYYICGQGPQLEELKKYAKKIGVDNQIHFLGFRTDMRELLQAADVFLFTTLQEGLPRSMMEAMASGLPCLASKIRGNVDLVNDNENGFLVAAKDSDRFAEKLSALAVDAELRATMRENNLERIKAFSLEVAEKEINKIYRNEIAKKTL